MSVLTWLGVLLGAASLLPLGRLLSLARTPASSGAQAGAIWVFVFAALVLGAVATTSARRVVRHRLRVPTRFPGLAWSGEDGRLTLERVRGHNCPTCGGPLRYRSLPLEWVDIYSPNGRKQRKVTRRGPALQCQRNEEHRFSVDPAEGPVQE